MYDRLDLGFFICPFIDPNLMCGGQLSSELAHANKMLPQVSTDRRLDPVLLNLSKQYVGESFGAAVSTAGGVKPEQIDQV
jgi:hypothetical protein